MKTPGSDHDQPPRPGKEARRSTGPGSGEAETFEGALEGSASPEVTVSNGFAAALRPTPLLALTFPLLVVMVVWAVVFAFWLPPESIIIVNGRYGVTEIPPGGLPMLVACAVSLAVALIVGLLLATAAVMAGIVRVEIGVRGSVVRVALAWKRVLLALLPIGLVWSAVVIAVVLANQFRVPDSVVWLGLAVVFLLAARLLFAVPLAIIRGQYADDVLAKGGWELGPYAIGVWLVVGGLLVFGANWVADLLDGTVIGFAAGLLLRLLVVVGVLLIGVGTAVEIMTESWELRDGWVDMFVRFASKPVQNAGAVGRGRTAAQGGIMSRPAGAWGIAVLALVLPSLLSASLVSANPSGAIAMTVTSIRGDDSPLDVIPFAGGRTLTVLGDEPHRDGAQSIQLCTPQGCGARAELMGPVWDVSAGPEDTFVTAEWRYVYDQDTVFDGSPAELSVSLIRFDDAEAAIAKAQEAEMAEEREALGKAGGRNSVPSPNHVSLWDPSALQQRRTVIRRLDADDAELNDNNWRSVGDTARVAVSQSNGVPVVAAIPPVRGFDQASAQVEVYRCDDVECASPQLQTFPLPASNEYSEDPLDLSVGDDGTVYVSVMMRVERTVSLRLLTIAPDGSFTDRVLSEELEKSKYLSDYDASLVVHDGAASVLYRASTSQNVKLLRCDDRACAHWSSTVVVAPPPPTPATDRWLEDWLPLRLAVDSTGRPIFAVNSPRGVDLVSCHDLRCTQRSRRALGLAGSRVVSLAVDDLDRPIAAVREPWFDDANEFVSTLSVPVPSVVRCLQRRCGAA